jgi:hypothetical protein
MPSASNCLAASNLDFSEINVIGIVGRVTPDMGHQHARHYEANAGFRLLRDSVNRGSGTILMELFGVLEPPIGKAIRGEHVEPTAGAMRAFASTQNTVAQAVP